MVGKHTAASSTIVPSLWKDTHQQTYNSARPTHSPRSLWYLRTLYPLKRQTWHEYTYTQKYIQRVYTALGVTRVITTRYMIRVGTSRMQEQNKEDNKKKTDRSIDHSCNARSKTRKNYCK